MKNSGEDVDPSKYAGFSLEVSLVQTGKPFLPNLGTILRGREQWRALILDLLQVDKENSEGYEFLLAKEK